MVRFVRGDVVNANRCAGAAMVDPDLALWADFLFPRDQKAESELRADEVDETSWIDVVEVSPMLSLEIRGQRQRAVLREKGTTTWPKGELSGELLSAFLDGLKVVRSAKDFSKDDGDILNRIVSRFERSIRDGRSVWLNF